jgi:hypothetical protein
MNTLLCSLMRGGVNDDNDDVAGHIGFSINLDIMQNKRKTIDIDANSSRNP